MKKIALFRTAAMVSGLLGMYTFAQAPASIPSAPASTTTSSETPSPSAPQASANPFPAIDPRNFTASAPSVATINSFLHALWGVDENRIWSVASVQPATAPGMVRVQVYIAEKPANRVGQAVFYITPDGKHLIAGDMVPFGTQPFTDTRALLQQRADGPARGAAGKDLELVEFSDLQCPSCKTAQGNIDQLLQDFPGARLVFEDVPQPSHPLAPQAAAVGYCVRQAKGDPAFFTYVQKIYDSQADLTKEKSDATLRAAITTTGADPNATMTCAGSPAALDAVQATSKLAVDAGIVNTPTLVINGRALPLSQIPYDTLKKMLVFQASLDGVTVKEQPSLKTLK